MEEVTVFLAELNKEQIQVQGDEVEVKLGWNLKGQFPVAESILPDFDTLALYYCTAGDKQKRTVVAVDAVYQDSDGFKTARLFGKIEDVPPLKESSQITVWFKPLPCPRRRIKICVVKYKGEQLFKWDDIMFDRLEAYDEFTGGQLTIIRDGELIDRTTSIKGVGTHAACTCFCGLEKLFSGDLRSWGIDSFAPEDFKVGDIFILDVLMPPSFDFARFLRGQACLSSAMNRVFDVMAPEGISLGEFGKDVKAKFHATANEFRGAKVIRFREKR